jgi:hypothetical protein
MQKALTEMNLQLHHVVSDITGATGMRIIRAIIAGERDPTVLALMRDTRCHAGVDIIEKALTGYYRAEHLFGLEQALALYDEYQQKVSACDMRIEAVLMTLASLRGNKGEPLGSPRRRHAPTGKWSCLRCPRSALCSTRKRSDPNPRSRTLPRAQACC